MIMKRLLLSFITMVAMFQLAVATIYYVPTNIATVQAALNTCAPMDTVIVAPGTYLEYLVWPTNVNGIKLLGSSSQTTILNAGGSNRGVTINGGNIDTLTVIKGFTFLGGGIIGGSGYGAGVYVNNASAIFDDVVITGNRVYVPGGNGYGAGVHLNSSSSIFRNCEITANSTDSATWCYGGGVYIDGGSPLFYNVLIAGNSMYAENWSYGIGMHITGNATVNMDRITIKDNFSGDNSIWYYGNGIYIDDSNVNMTNVLVSDNMSGLGGSFNYGGGIYCDGVSVVNIQHTTITNNTKMNNGNIDGSGIYVRDAQTSVINSITYNLNNSSETNTSGGGNLNIAYSTVRGGFGGTGNLSVPPLFVGATDYHITPFSPCAGSGTSTISIGWDLDNLPRPVPIATMPDMGCYEVDQSLTGLAETNSTTIQIYPNPARDNLTIQSRFLENITVRIYDVSGRIILDKTELTNKLTLYISEYDTGLYIVEINNDFKKKILIE